MSPGLQKRLRVYLFAGALAVILMSSTHTLDQEAWPQALIAALGLAVGILNIQGKEQTDRFLIAAIGVAVTVGGFLEVQKDILADQDYITNVIKNLELFITSALIYAAFRGIYDALKSDLTPIKKWLYGGAVLVVFLAMLAWFIGRFEIDVIIDGISVGLLLFLGLWVGILESPKSPQEASEVKGRRFLIAAVALQLTSNAVERIDSTKLMDYDKLIDFFRTLLLKSTLFTTTALLVIAMISIFFVLDELSEPS